MERILPFVPKVANGQQKKTCLHIARVVSSKRVEDAAVQFATATLTMFLANKFSAVGTHIHVHMHKIGENATQRSLFTSPVL